MPYSRTSSLIAVGLGEALFDCFPDRMVLGGAPLNFAYHAHQILSVVEGQGTVVSRIGTDPLGDRLLSELKPLHMDTRYIQRDAEHATGRVVVTLDTQQQPSYEIKADAAWDHLDFNPELRDLAMHCSAVCFGTLAQRNAESRDTIAKLLRSAPQAWRVYDINLRQEFFSADIIAGGCQAASMVKLNGEELFRVCDLLDIAAGENNAETKARSFAAAFSLEALAVTRGAQGTVLYWGDQRIEGTPVSIPFEANADSVGAGDACCAGLVCGLLLQWPLEKTVRFANEIGAFVASRPGATPALPRRIIDQITSAT